MDFCLSFPKKKVFFLSEPFTRSKRISIWYAFLTPPSVFFEMAFIDFQKAIIDVEWTREQEIIIIMNSLSKYFRFIKKHKHTHSCLSNELFLTNVVELETIKSFRWDWWKSKESKEIAAKSLKIKLFFAFSWLFTSFTHVQRLNNRDWSWREARGGHDHATMVLIYINLSQLMYQFRLFCFFDEKVA